jgi:hypothetical protein
MFNASMAEAGSRGAGQYVLRVKAPFLVKSQYNIDVAIQSKTNPDWMVKPCALVSAVIVYPML